MSEKEYRYIFLNQKEQNIKGYSVSDGRCLSFSVAVSSLGNKCCSPLRKCFRKIRLNSTWNTAFRVVSLENLREQQDVLKINKDRTVFPVRKGPNRNSCSGISV